MSEQERIDRFRAGRPAPTGSLRREKGALHPPPGRGRVGARNLLLLMLRGDRRHKRVHLRLWTCHSTSMSSIIRSRRIRSKRIRSSLNFSRVISIRRGMSIIRGIMLSLMRDISLSSLLSSSMSSLLSRSILSSSSLSNILSSMQRLVWRIRMGAFQRALRLDSFTRLW